MRRSTLASAALLAGCAPVADVVEPDGVREPIDMAAGRCDAATLGNLVGREATQALGGEALRRSGATRLRWIPPGAAVTMDYSLARLNIELDAKNRVTRLRCG